jgi:hypothetical protein
MARICTGHVRSLTVQYDVPLRGDPFTGIDSHPFQSFAQTAQILETSYWDGQPKPVIAANELN